MATVKIQFPEPLERFYYFTDDQVLTAGQLNQLAGHFDHEHRLTRTKGLGIGVICGLEVSVENNNRIQMTKGAAITSSGDLLKVGADTVFARFIKLQDENTVATEDGSVRVLRLGNEQKPIPMWRLYEVPTGNSQPVEGSESLEVLANSVNMADLAMVLLLDDHCKEPEECTDTNCDNMGITQMNDLLAVLVPKQFLTPTVNHPNRFHNLPRVAIRKVNMAGGTIKDVGNLYDRFEKAINDSTGSIIESFAKIGGGFPDLIKEAFGENNPVQRWASIVDKLLEKSENKAHIQYLYDFYKDMATALNEFKACVRYLPGQCCPPVDLFSKYIMASELVKPAGNRYPIYRHYFIESPILNGADERLEKSVFLLRRIDDMVNAFNASLAFAGSNAEKVRISPSVKNDHDLGRRAIPVYYDLKKRPTLMEHWDYEKYKQGLTDANQGYWMQDLSALEEVKDPFAFELDDCGFYRIEGVLNLKIDDAEKKVNDLRIQHNLGFKVETILIEDEPVKVRPKPFAFPDLNIMFRHYREELNSNLLLTNNYNLSLKQAFDQSDQEELKQVKDADGTDAFTNIKSALVDDTKVFTRSMEKVTTKMYRKLNDFEVDFGDFKKEYDNVATAGQTIDKKVSYSKQATLNSPINRLVLENNYRRFDYLLDVFKKRKDSLLKQYIFDRFFNQNTGLVHQGGVPDGGTFVLVYSSTTDRVVADFCLPYCCVVEVTEEEEHTPPVPPQVRPLPWIDKFDIVATPRIPKDFIKVTDLSGKLNLLNKPDELFKIQAEELTKTFNNRIGDLAQQLKTQESSLNEKLGAQEKVFSQRLDDHRSTYEALLSTKVSLFDEKLKTQVVRYDLKLEQQDKTIKELDQSVDTKVKGQAFDVIASSYKVEKTATDIGGGTVFNPGGTTNKFTTDDIGNAELKLKTKELDFTAERLAFLNDKQNLTAVEKREITTLQKKTEDLTLELSKTATSGQGDLQTGSDNEIVLNTLSNALAKSSAALPPASAKKIKEQLKNQGENSIRTGKQLEAKRINIIMGRLGG